jgi:serine/threonine protein kinase
MSESPPPENSSTDPPKVPPAVKIPICGSFCNHLRSGYTFHCKIPGYESCTIVKVLGEGTYGKVFLVKHESDGKLYAIKVFNRESKYQRAAKHEASILELVKGSPYVINLITTFEEKNDCCTHFCLLLPFFEMSLYDFFENAHQARSITSDVREKIRSLLLGLKWLHEKGILHCDLKPENILVDRNTGKIVICDLGSSCFISRPHPENMTSGSYRAQELMSKQVIYGKSSDFWAMGCVIVEFLLGKTIFNDMTDDEMRYMQRRIISIIQVEFEEIYSGSEVEEILLFITLFFQYKPEDRGKIEEILEHPFLREAISSSSRSAVSKKRSFEEPSFEEPSFEEQARAKKAPKVRDLLSPGEGVICSPPLPFNSCPFARLMQTSLDTSEAIANLASATDDGI